MDKLIQMSPSGSLGFRRLSREVNFSNTLPSVMLMDIKLTEMMLFDFLPSIPCKRICQVLISRLNLYG